MSKIEKKIKDILTIELNIWKEELKEEYDDGEPEGDLNIINSLEEDIRERIEEINHLCYLTDDALKENYKEELERGY